MHEASEPAARAARPWPAGHKLADRYELHETLGSGRLGPLYLATDTAASDRKVLVRCLPPALFAKESQRFQARRDLERLRALAYPAVAPVLELGEQDGVLYAVLGHVAGSTLRDRIAQDGGRMAPAEVSRWLRPVAEQLDLLHRVGYLHGAVRPSNVLLDRRGGVQLVDFCTLAALGATRLRQMARSGELPLDPDHLPPEHGAARLAGPELDRYALAVTVYEALAGELPFWGPTVEERLRHKTIYPPRPIAEAVPRIPQGAGIAVMQALSAHPAQRYETCTAFAEAFARGLESQRPEPVRRRPVPAARAAAAPSGRSRRVLIGVLLLAAGLAAAWAAGLL